MADDITGPAPMGRTGRSMSSGNRLVRLWRDPRYEAVAVAIRDEQIRLASGPADAPQQNPAIALARSSLQQAQENLDRQDIDGAWHGIMLARERLVSTWSATQIAAATIVLKAELGESGKLSAWRCTAIQNLLKTIGNNSATALDPGLEHDRLILARALRIRNEGVSHEFQRLSIARHYQAMLLVFGAPILIATLASLAWSASQLDQPHWERGPWPCLISALLGILGAITSAAQRSTKIVSSRIPQLLGSYVSSLSRIPIGMAAGVSVWLFSRAAVGADAVHSADMLLAAFGAGFAERLVVQSNASAGGTDRDGRRDTSS